MRTARSQPVPLPGLPGHRRRHRRGPHHWPIPGPGRTGPARRARTGRLPRGRPLPGQPPPPGRPPPASGSPATTIRPISRSPTTWRHGAGPSRPPPRPPGSARRPPCCRSTHRRHGQPRHTRPAEPARGRTAAKAACSRRRDWPAALNSAICGDAPRHGAGQQPPLPGSLTFELGGWQLTAVPVPACAAAADAAVLAPPAARVGPP